jgi:hypothetical protein
MALLDTFEYLEGAGIEWVGAGPDAGAAQSPVTLDAGGSRLTVFGVTDHPADFAATEDRPGVALANLDSEVPDWLSRGIRERSSGAALVFPHWGPNMVTEPLPRVREAADSLVTMGATLVAGHSAHVFHGINWPVLYDLGDFVDDYAIDPILRNDLGLLFQVTVDESGPSLIEALPLHLGYCHTEVAGAADVAWIKRRLITACMPFETEVTSRDDRLVIKRR